MSVDPLVIIGVIWSVVILSFLLYKENVAYRFAEYTMIGVAAGHATVSAINLIIGSNLSPLLKGNLLHIIPLLLGVLLLFKLKGKYAWLGRYAIALVVGVGTGDVIRSQMAASFIRQITSTLEIFTIRTPEQAFNVLVFMFALLSTISIFIFTVRPVGIMAPLPKVQKLGRLFVMFVLGTIFAHQVMSRMAMLAGVLQRLVALFGF